MRLNRIIPCLDVRDGRVVKGVRFQGLREIGDPVEIAGRYSDAGADEIVVLDVSATSEGRSATPALVRRIRAVVDVPVVVGGGIGDVETANRLLDAGADKVSVNTAAVMRPELVEALHDRFGRQCVVVAIDAIRRGRMVWELLVRSGRGRTGLDAVGWATRAVELGAGEILLTSHDRDGTRSGYDLELIRSTTRAVSVPVVASGGAASWRDFAAAFASGATGALAAGVLHEGRVGIGDLKRSLLASGTEIRTC
jgi:imidazoleglycerol phosphate synthase cyclase subunit